MHFNGGLTTRKCRRKIHAAQRLLNRIIMLITMVKKNRFQQASSTFVPRMHIMKIKLILSVHISVKQQQRWVFQFNFFFYFLDFVTLLSVKYNISSLFATSSRNPNGFKCIGVYLHSHICIEFMWVPPVWLSFNRVHCLWYPYPFQSFLVAASSVVFWCELARRFQQNQALVF